MNAHLYNQFLTCCKYGKLEELKSIWCEHDERLYLYHNCHELFINAIKYGHIELAKWLYQRPFDNKFDVILPINIHFGLERPFRLACYSGYLNIAHWLYDLSITQNRVIDIHVWNDYCFKFAERNQHIKLLNWLNKIDTTML